MYSAVIFDLDGTLLNTLTDLANAGNHTLEVLGFPTHAVDAYRYMVGNGIPKLIERMLPEGSRGPATQQTALSVFLRYYEAHKQDTTAPYPGILPMLHALKAAGLRLGVVSNKENTLSQEVAAHYFPGIFDAVAGHVLGTPAKPDPALVNSLIAQFGVQAGQVPVSYTHLDVYKRQLVFLATLAVHLFGLQRLGRGGHFLCAQRKRADGGVRAHIGALVALDALGDIPLRHGNRHAALLIRGRTLLELAVHIFLEGGNGQAVAVHLAHGEHYLRHHVHSGGVAGQVVRHGRILSVLPRGGHFHLVVSVKAGVDGLPAVSYTHLDVYKRQGQ